MRLLSLELRNICNHESLNLDFGSGLIGIFGPNGSGKSTAINAGPYLALTNDYGRVLGGKVGAVRQQAETHEPSWVKLRAEHQGTKFEVTRTLQPSSKHRLVCEALEEPLTKANEIRDWLERTLGLDRTITDDYLFVDQRELTAPLNESSTVRSKSLARLCRTTHGEACWVALGKQIEADRPLAGQVIDTSDGIRKRIGEYKAKLRTAKKAKSAAGKKRLKAQDRKIAQSTLDRRKAHGRLMDELVRAEAKEEDLLVGTRDAFKAAREASDAASVAQKDLVTAEGYERAAVSKLGTYRADKKRWDQRLARETKYNELSQQSIKHPVKPDLPDEDILRTAWSEAKADVIQWTRWIANAKEVGVCDECGSDLHGDAAVARLATLKRELPAREKEEEARDEQLTTWREYNTALTKAVAETKAHHKLLLAARLAVEEYSEVEKPREVNETHLQAVVNAAVDARIRFNGDPDDEDDEGLVGANREAIEKKSELKGKHRAAKERLAEIKKQRQENAVDDEEVVEAQQLLDADAEAKQHVTAAETLISAHEVSITEQTEELGRVQTLLSRSGRAQIWLRRQERMREVLHRDNLPRRVHRRALRRMESGINETLEQFDSPFWVRTDEELRFVAHFPNGTVMPGEGLSGGEQSVLALAFRWTLNSMFASQIGMLVLDEPTAWIDARNLDCLEAALTNLRGLVRAQGYQVIIITHHQQLQRVFDQVITLE